MIDGLTAPSTDKAVLLTHHRQDGLLENAVYCGEAIVTKKQAIELGLKKYHGAPCKYGHGPEKYVATRNCVTCQVERQRQPKKLTGWQQHAAQARPLGRRDRLEAKRGQFPPFKPLRTAAVVPRMVPLVDLKFNECHYPYGDAGNFRFCGLKKMDGKSPYCPEHCAIAYRPSDR
jgi:hypothetical protein